MMSYSKIVYENALKEMTNKFVEMEKSKSDLIKDIEKHFVAMTDESDKKVIKFIISKYK